MVYIEWGPTDCEENDHKHKHPDGSSTGCQSPDLKVVNSILICFIYNQPFYQEILLRPEGDCSFIYAYSISRPRSYDRVFCLMTFIIKIFSNYVILFLDLLLLSYGSYLSRPPQSNRYRKIC